MLYSGKAVVIHCKAGVGRSASFILAFIKIFIFPTWPLEKIYALLQERRPQVNLKPINFATVEKMVNVASDMFKKFKSVGQPTQDIQSLTQASLLKSYSLFKSVAADTKIRNVLDELAQYVMTDRDVWEISQLDAYLELYNYAYYSQHILTGTSHRAECINQFFIEIIKKQNTDWYIQLMQGKGPIQDLLDAQPGIYGGSPKTRLELVNNLKTELTAYFAERLKLTPEKIHEAILLANDKSMDDKSFVLIESEVVSSGIELAR